MIAAKGKQSNQNRKTTRADPADLSTEATGSLSDLQETKRQATQLKVFNCSQTFFYGTIHFKSSSTAITAPTVMAQNLYPKHLTATTIKLNDNSYLL